MERYLRTDKRVMLGESSGYWNFQNQVRANYSTRWSDHGSDYGLFDIFSEDLTAATDTLNQNLTQAIMLGWVDGFDPNSWVRRILPNVSQPTHEFMVRRLARDTPLFRMRDGVPEQINTVRQRRGTLLGDGLSMVQLTLHQLVKLEVGKYLLNLGWSPGDPYPDPTEYRRMGKVEEVAISSCLGDDMISVGPIIYNDILECLTIDMGDTPSVGTAYRSGPVGPRHSQSGVYLEEVIDIRWDPSKHDAEVRENNCFKLRLFTEEGPPSGPGGNQAWSSPVIGRIQSIANVAKWTLGQGIYNIVCQLQYEVYPSLKDLRREGLPIHMPVSIGGLGMISLPSYQSDQDWQDLQSNDWAVRKPALNRVKKQIWKDQLAQTAPWFRALLVPLKKGDLEIKRAIQPWKTLTEHGARFTSDTEDTLDSIKLNVQPEYKSLYEAADYYRDHSSGLSDSTVALLSVRKRDAVRGDLGWTPGSLAKALARPEIGLIAGHRLLALLIEAETQQRMLAGIADTRKPKPDSIWDWKDKVLKIRSKVASICDDSSLEFITTNIQPWEAAYLGEDVEFSGNWWYSLRDRQIAALAAARRSFILPTPGFPAGGDQRFHSSELHLALSEIVSKTDEVTPESPKGAPGSGWIIRDVDSLRSWRRQVDDLSSPHRGSYRAKGVLSPRRRVRMRNQRA
jgi:hypothetical protein